MTSRNVQLVTGILTTGEEYPTFHVDKSTGRVGIGNAATNPYDDDDDSNVFHVTGSMYATRFHGDGSALSGLTDSKWLSVDNDIYYSTGDVSIGIRESGGKRFRVHESGKDILTVDGAKEQTGINTIAPNASLHVNGSFINQSRWNLLNAVIQIDSEYNKIMISSGKSITTDSPMRVWGSYNNVPDWLIGAIGTNYINTTPNIETFTLITKCSVTGFLIDINSNVTDDWTKLDECSNIIHVDTNPPTLSQPFKIYIKTFSAGTYILDTSSLYAFIL
tara:strand:- start:1924 stop:2751 length:828 start_codon:yes stop_codon:yes gene_type:complete